MIERFFHQVTEKSVNENSKTATSLHYDDDNVAKF